MKRVIDFDVSVSGMFPITMRIEYESHYASKEEILSKPYTETKDVMREAIQALEKEIGHTDYDISYWYWIE